MVEVLDKLDSICGERNRAKVSGQRPFIKLLEKYALKREGRPFFRQP